MFNFFFKKTKQRKLSKVDYWRKWEFFELFEDLHKAEQLLSFGELSRRSDSDNFRSKFIEELHEIEGDNVMDFTKIWEWFSPGKEWDSATGANGSELGKKIFKRTDRWKRNQEFIPLTKVSLNNEFGVVLDKGNANDLIGLIRWDSEEESDIEDWRGLFGSFLQAGGQVISQDHNFKFINDKGEVKKPD